MEKRWTTNGGNKTKEKIDKTVIKKAWNYELNKEEQGTKCKINDGKKQTNIKTKTEGITQRQKKKCVRNVVTSGPLELWFMGTSKSRPSPVRGSRQADAPCRALQINTTLIHEVSLSWCSDEYSIRHLFPSGTHSTANTTPSVRPSVWMLLNPAYP